MFRVLPSPQKCIINLGLFEKVVQEAHEKFYVGLKKSLFPEKAKKPIKRPEDKDFCLFKLQAYSTKEQRQFQPLSTSEKALVQTLQSSRLSFPPPRKMYEKQLHKRYKKSSEFLFIFPPFLNHPLFHSVLPFPYPVLFCFCHSFRPFLCWAELVEVNF